MNNTTHVNSMRGLENLVSKLQKKMTGLSDNLSYQEMLISIKARTTTVTESFCGMKSTVNMTMEEYQVYIWMKIDSFPFNSTRPYDEETIKISDKCWGRMKNDPDYEQKMMNLIKDGRAQPDPFFGVGSTGTYWILEFDGGEGCRSHGFSKNFGGSAKDARAKFEKESEGGFWTNRAKKAKLQAEINEKYYQWKELLKEIGEHRAEIRHIEAQQQGLLHTSSDMPIAGVPAKFLLAGLMGGANI